MCWFTFSQKMVEWYYKLNKGIDMNRVKLNHEVGSSYIKLEEPKNDIVEFVVSILACSAMGGLLGLMLAYGLLFTGV